MAFNLFPREDRFFDLFDKQGFGMIKAAGYFKEIVAKGNFDEIEILRMHDIEHECDVITYDIVELLNKTFITPFDREDIHALAYEIDDIVDMIYCITKKIRLYKIHEINIDLLQFSDYIQQAVNALAKAMNGLRHIKNVRPILDNCKEVNKLESLGDQLKDAIIGKFLDNNPDPINFIKWKEIFEGTETLLDICESVTKVIESILVKQG